MRIPGLGGEVFKNLTLPGEFTSLQTGVIDANGWVHIMI